jgi:seryl-tRNA synthetase
MGKPADVMAFRQEWMEKGKELMAQVALPVDIDVANDSFFGRAGRLMKNNQRDQNLKFELLIPITSVSKPTACMSFNYHQDHFGKTWDLKTVDGETAHTACVGFGLERIALALFHHHGLDPKLWPKQVRDALFG